MDTKQNPLPEAFRNYLEKEYPILTENEYHKKYPNGSYMIYKSRREDQQFIATQAFLFAQGVKEKVPENIKSPEQIVTNDPSLIQDGLITIKRAIKCIKDYHAQFASVPSLIDWEVIIPDFKQYWDDYHNENGSYPSPLQVIYFFQSRPEFQSQGEKKSEWISIEESGLPKSDGDYLVTLKYNEVRTEAIIMNLSEGVWRDDILRGYKWDVIAYQEIPEPFELK